MGLDRLVAEIDEMLIWAEYLNDCTLEYKLNVYISPSYILKYITDTKTLSKG